ncbi:DUF4339 domain-containing protein [bacterium]|nr:DUF4339 domain-containing protein [bacterium]
MGLFSMFKGELIDIIEWTDESSNTLVYRFERQDNEIKNGAKLTVREGQVAVFINEGEMADVFNPGMYTLSTQNLPVLSTLKGWKYGFDSPFKAEVYFVNTRMFTDQKWGTKNPITLSDERFGMIELRAFGSYVFKVKHPRIFIKEIVGTKGHFTQEEIAQQLRSLIVARFTDAVGESGLPIEAYAANNKELSTLIHNNMRLEFENFGVELVGFFIENISMPEEVKKEIFELSRLNKIDINKLAQLKTAKAIEKAAENPSGTAGAGMGMGMGFAMANQMQQGFSQNANGSGSASTPPPLPGQAQWYAAVNGQQQGPLAVDDLKTLITSGNINRDTLVWKAGMENWLAAESTELKALFSQVPPPLPK